MALLPIIVTIFIGLLHITFAQYAASNGMVAIVTNGAYGQVPVIDLPPAEVAVIEEDPAIIEDAVVEAPVTRMFFRSNGVNYETASAPVTNGYGASAAAPVEATSNERFHRVFRINGQRNNVFFRSNAAVYGSSAEPSTGARFNGFLRLSNGYATTTPAPISAAPATNGYGAPVASNGARFSGFLRSSNGYAAATPAQVSAAPMTNGYGAPAASNGARFSGFLRSSNGYAAATQAPAPAAPVTNGYGAPAVSNAARSFRLFRTNSARSQRNFLRSNGFSRSGSYTAATSAPSTNGYSTSAPAPAPAQFLPTELAEGVSIPQIPGVAGVDYPIFNQALVTSFSCSENAAAGYYADAETKCQVFYLCQPYADKISFLCPNGTMFNEKHSVCDWWYNVKCGRNGYSSYAPSATVYSPPSAPVQQSYQMQVQEAIPVVIEEVPAVAGEIPATTEEVSEEPITDTAADPALSTEVTGETLRMLRFRSNRLRPRGRSQFRFNRLRNNAASQYQQQAEIAPEEMVTETPAPTNHYNNGGRKSRIMLRTNRLRFRGMRNEATGEVHYGMQNGNEIAATLAPAEPAITELTPSVVPEAQVTDMSDVTNGEVPVVEEAATVTEEPVVVSEETSTNGSEEPVIVLLNGDAQVNGEGVATTNGSNDNGASTTNGVSASTNGNGVVSVVNGNAYGGARFGRRLRPLIRSFVRPRSGFLRMAASDLAGTRYDPSTVAANGNNAVFFRARRF